MSQPRNHPGTRASGYDRVRNAWSGTDEGPALSHFVRSATLKTLVLAFQVALALCTFGLYPLIPWVFRWHNRQAFNADVRREQYRQQVRRAARERRR